MNFKELLVVVPELLLLVVPGYISIKLKEKYRLEKKSEKLDITLQSILISFIIGIIYSVLETLLKPIIPNSFQFLESTSVKQAGYLLLGVIFGLFFIKLPKTKIGVFTLKVFNRNLSPEPSVWLKAMENNNGAWATIYLENGLIYTGMLINYTSDSNEEKKEVLLSNYRLSVRNQSTAKGPENFCTVIEDYTDNANAKVFLSQNVIVAIEIIS